MAVALRQEDTPIGFGALGTSITSNALPSSALLGSVIEVWVACGSGVSISSVVDSASQNYSLIGSINDPTDSSFISCYAFTNNASATALTVTANFSNTQPRNIHVREITGAKNQLPDTYNFPARIVNPGTGTDAISIALTSSGSPALISGFIAAVVGGGATIVAGTGFTGTIGLASGNGYGHSLFQTKRVTGSGSNPCTWTDATNGGATTYLGGAVIWDEAPAAALVGAPYYLESDEYF